MSGDSSESGSAPLSRQRLALGLLLGALGLYGLHALLAIAVRRHLYGDAAWFLIRVASEGRATSFVTDFAREFYYSRALAFWTTQGPAVLLLHLGVRNLQALSYVFGACLFGCKLISLIVCYRLLPREEKPFIVFPVLGLFAGTINSDVYIVSETHLGTSLAWPILIALQRGRGSRLGATVTGLFIAATALIHETFAIFAVLMLAVVARGWWRRGRRAEADSFAFMILLAAVTAVNLAGILLPRDAVNRGAFTAGLLNLVSTTLGGLGGLHVGPVVSVVVVAAVLATVIGPSLPRRTVPPLLIGAVGAVAAVFPPAHFFRFSDRLVLENAIDDRGFAGAAIPFLLMVAFLAVHALRRGAFLRRAGAVSVLVASLMVGQVAWQLLVTRFWTQAIADARAHLESEEGPLWCPTPGASAQRIRAEREVCKWWITPLSIVLSPGARVRSLIISRQRVFQAFDATSPTGLPGLRHVDHDYGPYLAALASWKGPEAGLPPGQTVRFVEGARGAAMLHEGFSDPENWATWTDGERARLEVCGLSPPPGKGIRLLFHVTPFAPPGGAPSDVDVVVGELRWRWRFAPEDRLTAREVLLPREAIPPNGCAELWFVIAQPRSPNELGMSVDRRRLGLALVDLEREDRK